MKEIELSFVFDLNKAPIIDGGELITDYYINPNLRLRKYCSNLFLTSKSGNKSSGVREEHETKLSFDKNIEDIFKAQSKLTVHKRRVSVNGYTIDYIESPIKIGIIEKEFGDIQQLQDIQRRAIEQGLVVCPLNAWDFNKRKIAIGGGPSSGKTTMAKSVSIKLNNEFGASTSDVVEYATSFIQKSQRIPTFNDQVLICSKQSDRERAVASTANLVLSDSPIFLSYIYGLRGLAQLGATPETDYAIKALYKRSVESLSTYDKVILLKTLEYKENGVRYHSFDQSKEIYNEIKNFVVNHGYNKKIGEYDYTSIDNIIDNILYINDYDKIVSVLQK